MLQLIQPQNTKTLSVTNSINRSPSGYRLFLVPLALFIFCVAARTVWATSPDYTVTTSSGASIVPGTSDTGNHCDDCVTGIALPFPVSLYDQVFTTVNIGSNGTLQFGSSSAAYSNVCLPTGGFGYTIFPFWDDLYTADAGSGEGVFTSVSGSAPQRIFNIEWRTQYCCNAGPPINDFEVRLYERQPRFDIIY